MDQLFLLSIICFVAALFSDNKEEGLRHLWRSFLGENESAKQRSQQSTSDLFKSISSDRRRRTNTERAAAQSGDECWVPYGNSVSIKGYRIGRGLIYVGHGLYSDKFAYEKENCLIDPDLPVDSNRPDYRGESMSYWPSYSYITPQARAAYLDWLAKGANQENVYVGYVFLYFYGLERRLMKDQSLEELDTIGREVSRLKKLYGHMGSFGSYADGLLEAAVLLKNRENLYRYSPNVSKAYEPRMVTRIALAQAALQQHPIHADWMLAWLYEDPNTNLRRPALRAPEEIKELFRFKFKQLFSNGFTIKPNKGKLRLDYRAASSTFNATLDTGYPDIVKLVGPLNKVRPLLMECCDKLDAFSRYIGRYPEKQSSRHAIGLLPRMLASKRIKDSKDEFLSWLIQSFTKSGFAVANGEELTKRWIGADTKLLTKSGMLRKNSAEGLSRFLGHINIGIEPDVQITGKSPKKTDKVILFCGKTPPCTELSDKYWQAATLLKLMAAVAHADKEIRLEEKKKLISHIRSLDNLKPGELSRLAAYLYFLLSNPSSLRNVQDEVNTHIAIDNRREVAELALITAVADGHFDPRESKIIAKIYEFLGLDPQTIYSDLHALGADQGLTKVQSKKAGAPGFVIPKPVKAKVRGQEEPGAGGEEKTVVELDLDLVKAKIEDTRKAASLLHQVFSEEEEIIVEEEIQPQGEKSEGIFGGLQNNVSDLLKVLVTKSVWDNVEYQKMASGLGLMPEGALEAINEWSFDKIGEAILEGGDQIEIYLDIWEEYIDEQKPN